MSTFNEWLESGTIKRRTVNLYADAALMDEMAALSDKIDQVRAEEARDAENGDRTMSSKSQIPALEAEAEALWERYEASKSVWHVRATTTAERDEALEKFPSEDAPIMPNRNAPMAVKRAWEKARDEWKPRAVKAETERRLWLLSKVVERVEIGERVIESVTVDDLRAMLKAAYGSQRIGMLWAAVNEASSQGEAPVPFSRTDSETIPD